MQRSFVQSVLSGQKQRQRFSYFRNIAALGCAIAAYNITGGNIGFVLGGLGLVLGYLTIAPIIAFIICLAEQMFS